MDTERLNLRLGVQTKAWLNANAKANNRSMNAEVEHLLAKAMIEAPLKVVFRECLLLGEHFYAVSLGEYGDDFCETSSKAEAMLAARGKTKELGLSLKAIEYRYAYDDDLFGDVVSEQDIK